MKIDETDICLGMDLSVFLWGCKKKVTNLRKFYVSAFFKVIQDNFVGFLSAGTVAQLFTVTHFTYTTHKGFKGGFAGFLFDFGI